MLVRQAKTENQQLPLACLTNALLYLLALHRRRASFVGLWAGYLLFCEGKGFFQLPSFKKQQQQQTKAKTKTKKRKKSKIKYK